MMDRTYLDRLRLEGLEADLALDRLMGNEALLERLLLKWKEDQSFQALSEALDKGDSEKAFPLSHTLKGMTGNLAMTKLYELFSRQTELLRSGDVAAARDMMDEISPLYERMRAAI